jgi:uncharacterized membrane protein YgcG
MIPLSRRRPRSITGFAVLFFSAALLAFLEGMLSLADQQVQLQQAYPALTWTRDAVIVWQSAWLSIALIPIAMVWLSAVRFARWMVTAMAGLKLLGLVTVASKGWAVLGMLSPFWLMSSLLRLLAVALLFTPASNRWFEGTFGQDDAAPAIFE